MFKCESSSFRCGQAEWYIFGTISSSLALKRATLPRCVVNGCVSRQSPPAHYASARHAHKCSILSCTIAKGGSMLFAFPTRRSLSGFLTRNEKCAICCTLYICQRAHIVACICIHFDGLALWVPGFSANRLVYSCYVSTWMTWQFILFSSFFFCLYFVALYYLSSSMSTWSEAIPRCTIVMCFQYSDLFAGSHSIRFQHLLADWCFWPITMCVN